MEPSNTRGELLEENQLMDAIGCCGMGRLGNLGHVTELLTPEHRPRSA